MFFALLGSSFCILAVSKGPTQEITNRTLFHFLEVIPSRRLFNVAQVLVFKFFWFGMLQSTLKDAFSCKHRRLSG